MLVIFDAKWVVSGVAGVNLIVGVTLDPARGVDNEGKEEATGATGAVELDTPAVPACLALEVLMAVNESSASDNVALVPCP